MLSIRALRLLSCTKSHNVRRSVLTSSVSVNGPRTSLLNQSRRLGIQNHWKYYSDNAPKSPVTSDVRLQVIRTNISHIYFLLAHSQVFSLCFASTNRFLSPKEAQSGRFFQFFLFFAVISSLNTQKSHDSLYMMAIFFVPTQNHLSAAAPLRLTFRFGFICRAILTFNVQKYAA